MIALTIVFSARVLPLGNVSTAGFFGFVIALAAFLAASGGPRLSRSSEQLSSVLAIVIVFVSSLSLEVSLLVSLLTAAALGVTGLRVGRAPTLIRRVEMTGIGKVEMTRRYRQPP